jgi:hypothetical protein
MTDVCALDKNLLQENEKLKTGIPGLEPGYEEQKEGCIYEI